MRHLIVLIVLIGAGCQSVIKKDIPEIFAETEGLYYSGENLIVPTSVKSLNGKLILSYGKCFYPALTYDSGFTHFSDGKWIIDPAHLDNMEIMFQWMMERREMCHDRHIPTSPPAPTMTYNHKVVKTPPKVVIEPPKPDKRQLTDYDLELLYWEGQHAKQYYPDVYEALYLTDKYYLKSVEMFEEEFKRLYER